MKASWAEEIGQVLRVGPTGCTNDACSDRPAVPSTQALEPRVAATEARLCGVSNLAGRLMALDQIAQELGVRVPQAEVGAKQLLAPAKRKHAGALAYLLKRQT